jgi:hypothetical protein
VPVLVQLGAWGRKFLPVSPELSIRSKVLEDGGPQLWDRFMEELRTMHLGAPPRGHPSVFEELEHAYQEAVAAGESSPG